jgi:hypothetical protein
MTVKRKNSKTSKAKIIANRKNSLKSTGPVTTEGKDIAKWNCLQHGLLAKAAVIRKGYAKEDAQELKYLLAQLCDQYCPKGVIEEMLIEKIAIAYWRLRRCQQAEVGEILQETFHAIPNRLNTSEKAFYQKINQPMEPGEFRYWTYAQYSTGIRHIILHLENAQSDLYTNKKISEECQKSLKYLIENTQFYIEIFASNISYRSQVKLVESTLDHFRKQLETYKEAEGMADYSFVESARVSASIRGDLRVRYENSIDRQLYRAISELERLQSLRIGLLVE